MYTEEEIRSAVEKLVVSKTRFPVDTRSGTRNVEVTFGDIQEAAASVFLLNHDALFYLASLSAKRLRFNVSAYQDAAQQLYTLVEALERTSVPISSVTPLEDAKSALLQLESVSGTSKSTQVGSSPAYLRFRSKVDEFLGAVKSNVVHNGDVVPSMVEAASTINSLMAALPTTHAEIVERLSLIANLQSTYSSLKLPHVMLASTVAKARKLVGYKAYRIKNQTEEQNQEEIRQTVLDLLAAKAVIKRAALFTEPQLDRGMAGTATPFADATREATPAVVETVDGPFDIRDTSSGGTGASTLTFEFDGSASTYDVEIPAVTELVQMDGFSPGPFTFTSSDLAAELVSLAIGSPTLAAGVKLKLFLSWYDAPDTETKNVSTTFTSGVTNAATMASDIQSAFVVAGVDGHFSASGASGRVVITALTAGSQSYIQVVDMDDELVDVLGAHWEGKLARGLDVNNVLNIRTGSSASPQEQYFTFPDGEYTVDDVAAHIMSTPPTIPLEASAEYVTYATPPYRIVRIKYTGADADAILETVATYDPGGGDQPAEAYKVLYLYGAMDREAARMGALKLLDLLTQAVDPVTSQTEIFNRSDMEVVGDKVVITSKDVTTASRVKVSGDGCQQFFGSATVEVIGSTGWVELSEQNDISEGDTVSVSTTGQYVVDAVQDNYVHLSTEMDADHPTINFDSQTGVYGSVTYGKKETLDSFSSAILIWLEQWEDASSYFTELTRLLNFVLVDKNPTSGEINDVLAHLDTLVAGLTSIYETLLEHDVERAEDLDNVIRTYREKGCERAVDLLLECRLADFFGLSVEEASYAGRMLEAVKGVARNDMPVSRYDRRENSSRLLATVPSPDYDTDFSDSEDEDMLNDDHFAIDAN